MLRCGPALVKLANDPMFSGHDPGKSSCQCEADCNTLYRTTDLACVALQCVLPMPYLQYLQGPQRQAASCIVLADLPAH